MVFGGFAIYRFVLECQKCNWCREFKYNEGGVLQHVVKQDNSEKNLADFYQAHGCPQCKSQKLVRKDKGTFYGLG